MQHLQALTPARLWSGSVTFVRRRATVLRAVLAVVVAVLILAVAPAYVERLHPSPPQETVEYVDDEPSTTPSWAEPGYGLSRSATVKETFHGDGSTTVVATITATRGDPLVTAVQSGGDWHEVFAVVAGVELPEASSVHSYVSFDRTRPTASIVAEGTVTVDQNMALYEQDSDSAVFSPAARRPDTVVFTPLTLDVEVEGGHVDGYSSVDTIVYRSDTRLVARTNASTFASQTPQLTVTYDKKVFRETEPPRGLDLSVLLWPLSLVLPWILVWRALRGVAARHWLLLRSAVAAYVGLVPVIGLAAVTLDTVDVEGDFFAYALLFGLPVGLATSLVLRATRSTPQVKALWVFPAVIAVTSAVTACRFGWGVATSRSPASALAWLLLVLVPVGAVLVGCRLVPAAVLGGGRWPIVAATAPGAVAAVLAYADVEDRVVYLLLGLSAAGAAVALLELLTNLPTLAVFTLSAPLTVALFDLSSITDPDVTSSSPLSPVPIAESVAVLADVLLLLWLIAALLLDGRAPATPAQPHHIWASIACLMVVARPLTGDVAAVVVTVLVAAGTRGLLPPGRLPAVDGIWRLRAGHLRDLLEVRSATHVAERTLLELKRSAPGKLIDDASKRADVQSLRASMLQVAHRGRRVYAAGTTRADASLGSALGSSNAQNALASAFVAVVVAVAATCLNLWMFPDLRPPDFAGVVLLAFARWTLRWAGLGFLFGYLYPLLRGVSPLAKATGLGVVLVLAETVASLTAGAPHSWVAAALQAAQVAVLVIVLTLHWEWRAGRAARVPFLFVRDLRSFRAVALPVSALVLAASTAAGTAIAGAAVSPLLAPAPDSRQPPTTPPTTPAASPPKGSG